MLKSDRVRTLVSTLQLDRILTGTDCPFTSVGGRPASPPDVAGVAAELAGFHGVDRALLSKMVRENLLAMPAWRTAHGLLVL